MSECLGRYSQVISLALNTIESLSSQVHYVEIIVHDTHCGTSFGLELLNTPLLLHIIGIHILGLHITLVQFSWPRMIVRIVVMIVVGASYGILNNVGLGVLCILLFRGLS